MLPSLLFLAVVVAGIGLWISSPQPEDEPVPLGKEAADQLLQSVSFSAAELASPAVADSLRKAVETQGFTVLKGFLSSTEISQWRQRAVKHVCEEAPQLEFGYCLCDLPSQEPFAGILDQLLAKQEVKQVFTALTGSLGYRFAGHSDISCDKVIFWHKDKLNGRYAQYQKLSPWSPGGEHKIYKLLMYLQDHRNDTEALRVVPGSHVESVVNLKGARYMQVHPNLGDVVVIDQRVTHTGQSRVRAGAHRVLVSLGFGADNAWTDEFQNGTEARQAADTQAVRDRAQQPAWRRDVTKLLHDHLLRPALGFVYSSVSPLQVLQLASRVYG